MVMGRDFWFKRFRPMRLRHAVSFTAVRPSPLDSPPVVETFWRRRRQLHRGAELRTMPRYTPNSVSMFRVMVAGNALNMFEPAPAGRA